MQYVMGSAFPCVLALSDSTSFQLSLIRVRISSPPNANANANNNNNNKIVLCIRSLFFFGWLVSGFAAAAAEGGRERLAFCFWGLGIGFDWEGWWRWRR